MGGIKRKIITNTILITVILAITTTAILAITTNKLINTTLMETLTPFAQTASKSIESNLHIMADRIFLIADNAVFTDETATQQDKQQALDHAASGIEFTWLALYTPDGRLYTGSKNSPRQITDQSLFQQMKETQNLVIDDTKAADQGLEIAVGKPLLSGDNIVYYLVGSYKYDLLNDIISNIHIGYSGHAYIINQNGQIMAHQNTDIVKEQRNVADLYQSDQDLLELTEKMNQGLLGSTSISIDGKETLFAYAPVRGTNWYLAITVPKSEFMGIANFAMFFNVGTVALLLILSFIYIARFSGRISQALGRVTSRLQQLSAGDLTSDVVVVKTGDEAETLSLCLKDTIADINGYISKLRQALGQLSDGNLDITVDGSFAGDFVIMKDSLNNIIDFLNNMMLNLQRFSTDLTGSSGQMAQSAQNLKHASENQSAALQHLAAETATISQEILVVDEHAKTTRSLMEQAEEKLNLSTKAMEDTLASMDNIRQNAEAITNITKFLEDIAFQTNLLALNASIEAARAGAAGHGFSIVASEVQRLAAQSADSAKRTAEIIKQTSLAIQSGSDQAKKTAVSVAEVVEISRTISDITVNLAQSVEHEKQALANVTQDISSISQMAQQSLNSSREVSAFSDTLAHQANSLQEMSDRFTLRSGNRQLNPAMDAAKQPNPQPAKYTNNEEVTYYA